VVIKSGLPDKIEANFVNAFGANGFELVDGRTQRIGFPFRFVVRIANFICRNAPMGRFYHRRFYHAGRFYHRRFYHAGRFYGGCIFTISTIINHHNRVKMIRHHDPFIQFNIWANRFGFAPFPEGKPSARPRRFFPFHSKSFFHHEYPQKNPHDFPCKLSQNKNRPRRNPNPSNEQIQCDIFLGTIDSSKKIYKILPKNLVNPTNLPTGRQVRVQTTKLPEPPTNYKNHSFTQPTPPAPAGRQEFL
jgi:hypothetical protein